MYSCRAKGMSYADTHRWVTPPALRSTNDIRDLLILPQKSVCPKIKYEHFDSMMLKCFIAMKEMPFSHSSCSYNTVHFVALILISICSLQNFSTEQN